MLKDALNSFFQHRLEFCIVVGVATLLEAESVFRGGFFK